MPYGQAIEWPDHARLVITTSVMFEEGGEVYPDSKALGPLPPMDWTKYRDYPTLSWFKYGCEVAVPRLLDIFDRQGIKTTFFVVGKACEINPQLVREIARREHEIAGHGWVWVDQYEMDLETEREFIRKSVEVIERTVGQRPLGWNCYALRDSDYTLELLVEQGFVYHIDEVSDDVPFLREVAGRPFVTVPYTIHLNDLVMVGFQGVTAPQLFEAYRYEFDWLYEESKRHPTMMTISCHPRVGGRPGTAKALNDFITYAKQHEGVAFMRKIDIANWWLKRYGAQAVRAART